MLDTSDAYGGGRNEELIALSLKGSRAGMSIATKFGNMGRNPGRVGGGRGRPEYVRLACERSLARLGTEIIDLYYIHRVDPRVPIEDTVGAMGELVREGKVRFLGISEAGEETIRRAHATHPLSAVQIEYSLWSREVEHSILPLCQQLGIGFVAYSPLGRGFLTGTVSAQDDLGAATRAAICRASSREIWRTTSTSSLNCDGLRQPRDARRRNWRSPGYCRAATTSCRSPEPAIGNGWRRTPRRRR